jgi:hypothetical protein
VLINIWKPLRASKKTYREVDSMSLLKKRYYFFDNDNPFSLLSEFDTIVDDILRKFNV